MSDQPVKKHEYEHDLWTTTRWEKFRAREDDILVCTSYKAGTTWTQNICALLIFQTPDFGQRLTDISPWVEVLTGPVEDVLAIYEAQTHRRFIKTHTPLDGLNYDPRLDYVYCGREPRDVFMSMLNHIANTDYEKVAELREAQGLAPLPDVSEMPDDIDVLFQMWLTTGSFAWEHDGFPFWSHFNHAQSFWNYRHLPNIHFLHYDDLKKDLDGQMRQLAARLGIEVAEAKWPELVHAATFDAMKSKASTLAPEANVDLWKDASQFFNKGESGQWRGALSDESIALYERLLPEKLSPGLAAWLEKGSLICGAPDTLPD